MKQVDVFGSAYIVGWYLLLLSFGAVYLMVQGGYISPESASEAAMRILLLTCGLWVLMALAVFPVRPTVYQWVYLSLFSLIAGPLIYALIRAARHHHFDDIQENLRKKAQYAVQRTR